MTIVYSLVESNYEEAYTHSVYSTKRAAYKSMLMLMRKRVTDALDLYRLTGESAAEYCYRNHSDRLTVCEEKVWSESDLLELVEAANNTTSNNEFIEV